MSTVAYCLFLTKLHNIKEFQIQIINTSTDIQFTKIKLFNNSFIKLQFHCQKISKSVMDSDKEDV